MSNRSASFHTVHPNPDYGALRAQLGALPGVCSMELDWNNREVTVDYNDDALSYQWLQNRMGAIGYLPCPNQRN